MPSHPEDDSVATILRDHFLTEHADAGLRSLDLSGSGVRGSSSPDAGAVARAATNRQDEHRRCREALRKIGREFANVLALAYGTPLRDRETDDHTGRRAPKRTERDWRVRLHEQYDLGSCVAIVLASPFALRESARVGQSNVREWLLGERSKAERDRTAEEALVLLRNAKAAFSAAYEPPKHRPRLDAQPRPRRGRPFDESRIQFAALGGIHNTEIFRR